MAQAEFYDLQTDFRQSTRGGEMIKRCLNLPATSPPSSRLLSRLLSEKLARTKVDTDICQYQ